MTKKRIVVLDTETTGFANKPWSRVVELAAVLIGEQGEIETWERLVIPDILDARAAGAFVVNHLSEDLIRNQGMPTETAVASFREWLQEYGNPPVTSFNVEFDRAMVERMGLTDLVWTDCVMLRAMAIMGPAGALPPGLYGGWKWPKLSEAAAFFKVSVVGQSHRALTDARTAAGVWMAMGEP